MSGDQTLRLRENTATDEGLLEYYRVLFEYEMDETELSIDSVDNAMKILTLLGYENTYVVNKQRTEYTNGKVLITMDHIEGFGDFVKLELDGEFSEKTEQTIAELIDQSTSVMRIE